MVLVIVMGNVGILMAIVNSQWSMVISSRDCNRMTKGFQPDKLLQDLTII